jgi:hypothetical protein
MLLTDKQASPKGRKDKGDKAGADKLESGGKSSGIDEKDIGIKLPNPSSDETFEMTFNKEVDLEMNEVPVVLFELHENSLLYMDREEWERALILLQKAQVLIEQMNLENYKKDRLIIVIIFHNTAL